jgi:hypothetical protein
VHVFNLGNVVEECGTAVGELSTVNKQGKQGKQGDTGTNLFTRLAQRSRARWNRHRTGS